MLPSFKGRVSKRDSGKASRCQGEEEEEMKAPAIGERAFLFVFVRQAEGRDGSVLLLDPSQAHSGAITLVEKDTAKTQRGQTAGARGKGVEARGLQFSWRAVMQEGKPVAF